MRKMIAIAFAASLGLCTVSAGAMPIATLNGESDAMITQRRAGMRSRNASRTCWPLPADLLRVRGACIPGPTVSTASAIANDRDLAI